MSLWKPAVSQGSADLTKVPAEIGLDWLYLPLYPLAEKWGGWGLWALLGGVLDMLAGMPWLPPFRRTPAAEVDLANCNGCNRCVEDCPYEAIRLVPRTDGEPFPQQARYLPTCACARHLHGPLSSRRRSGAPRNCRTGIDLPGQPLRELRERGGRVGELHGDSRVLVLACEHGAGGAAIGGVVTFPCVAMIPPSLIDYILSRNLADGVVVAGCSESLCYNRLGVEWTKEALCRQRDPYLRKRVPRERLASSGPRLFGDRSFRGRESSFHRAPAGSWGRSPGRMHGRGADDELEPQA